MIGAFFARYAFKPVPVYRWVDTSIAVYREPIPEFVLETALEIKRAFTECDITIQSLRNIVADNTNPADPFLVCSYAGYDYWLEVWNEPLFAAKREE